MFFLGPELISHHFCSSRWPVIPHSSLACAGGWVIALTSQSPGFNLTEKCRIPSLQELSMSDHPQTLEIAGVPSTDPVCAQMVWDTGVVVASWAGDSHSSDQISQKGSSSADLRHLPCTKLCSLHPFSGHCPGQMDGGKGCVALWPKQVSMPLKCPCSHYLCTSPSQVRSLG